MSELSTEWKVPSTSVTDDVDDGIAERALAGRVLGRLADGGDVLPRHRAADDPVAELEALAARARRDVELDVGELAVAAGLALEPRVLVRPRGGSSP